MRIKKIEIIFGILLIFFYLLTRFTNLTLLPIFTDEAIYLRWAQIAKNDASWRFISLTDGKQPLFVWLAMVAMKFVKDPLFAGRLVSVAAGLVSLIGIFLLGWEVFQSKSAGFFSSFLYLIFPFSLMYDRMALMDCLVATFSIWSLYLEALLVKTLRLDVALILGMVLGGGVLTKTSGFFNIYLLPTTLLLFNFKEKNWKQNLVKWTGLALLSIFLSQGYYSVLRLSPFFHMIAQKDATFVYPLGQWLKHPFRFFVGNLKGQYDWLKTYLTFPILFLVTGSIFIFWRKTRAKLLLFLWFLAPFLALALFGKVIYPRFLLFMSIPLLVLGAWLLSHLTIKQFNNRATRIIYLLVIFTFFFGMPLYSDFKILFDPANAPIPESDLGQYINNWPAGGGVKEVVSYLKNQAQKQPIFVGTEGTFGLFPASLELYLIDTKNIEIKGYWPFGEEVISQLKKKAKEKPTYLVTKETQKVPEDWPLELIFKIKKGRSNVYLHFFKVKP